MPRGTTRHRAVVLDLVVRACALAVLLIGLVVLAGWALKFEALKSGLPGFASMKPNAALALVLAGIALALALQPRSGLRLGCAAAVLMLGGLSLAQDVSGANFGTDQILFRDLPGAAQTVSPGRMSPITAVCLILLGGALALLGSHRTALHRFRDALALLALALALPALIGYAYGTESIYPLPGFGSMALATALALPLLALGILSAHAGGLAAVFTSAGLGGQVARRFLPLALVSPLLLGWLAQKGENAGLFNVQQDIAVFAAAMMLVLVVITGRIAKSLAASDAGHQRAEVSRAQLAAELASLYATAPVGLFMVDTDMRYVSVNQAMAKLNGLTAEQHIGRRLREVSASLLADAVEPQLRQVLTSGRPVLNCEVQGGTVPTSDEHRYWLVSYYPVLAEDGAVRGVHGAVQEITECKQAERLLRQNHDTFFNLIQNAPFGLYIVDAQFRLCQVSRASQKVFSNIVPLLGRDFEDVLRLVWAEPFVSDALGRFRHTLATGQPYAAPNTTELRQNTPDVESYDWKIERITLPDGQFAVVCYFYDITERMQSDQALRESEAFSRSVLKSSPDCVKVLDLKGNLLSMQSGQELLGIEDIQPFLNKSWLDFWRAQDRVLAQAALAAALAGGVGHFVGLFRTLRGEAKWWEVLISPILGANDQPARLLAVSRDVTERQQAEAVLRQRSAQFETLVNEAPLGIYLVDADFRLRQVNPTARPAFGNIADLIGSDFAEVMRILWPAAHAASVIGQFRQTLDSGVACYVAEMIEQRVDRSTTEYYEWQINRIPLPDGRHGVVCYFRDISEGVFAKRQIVESETRYRSLFNSIDEGFCVIEMIFDEHDKPIDYRFLEVNPAFEKQTGLHAATGKRIRELNPGLEAHWFEIYGQVALTGEPVRFTNQAKALDGRWFDVYALRLGGPPSARVALLFSDISARKGSEQALLESNEELTAFNRVAVGRELRMIELKQEVNRLCALAGQPARFALAIEGEAP